MMFKKLEWQKNIDGDYEAQAFQGRYVIYEQACPSVLVSWEFGQNHRNIKNKNTQGFKSFQAAQDAAQLDFEKTVCDCYDLTVDIEQVVP